MSTTAAKTANYVTGDAAFAVNQHGEIVLWNPAAEKTFGHSAGEALGQKCWKLLSGLDMYGNRYCCEHCPISEMAARHESVHSFQLSMRTASKGRKTFATSCLEVYGSGGNVVLLHICHATEEASEDAENNHFNGRPSANSRRGALTQRELEVLSLLAEGNTTSEIASLMCISQATVRNHVQHLLYKLHVHNRLEAVVMGQRLDLI